MNHQTSTTNRAMPRRTKTLSFTAERARNQSKLRATVKQYSPFLYKGVHEKRGRCACGGLAITRLIFVGKYRKKLLLHANCAREAGLKIPS